MIHHLTLVHLFLAVGAGGCIYLALREVRRRYISQWRLFAPAALALFVAFIMVLLQIARHPPWIFGATLGVGLAVGVARGLTIQIEHDMYRPRVNISYTAKLLLLWVAFAVGAAAGVEIVGTFTGASLEAGRYWATLVATMCAGAMLGRAFALTIRLHRHS